MKQKRILIIIAALSIAVLTTLFFAYSLGKHAGQRISGDATNSLSEKGALYSCPMHPSVTSNRPGKCPVCHMDLHRIDEASGETNSAPKAKTAGKVLYYRNPMNPTVTSPVPTKDPMGMDYIPVYAEETQGNQVSDVSGRASFTLSEARQQLIGLTTAKASVRDMGREVRASGQVAFDPDLFTAIEEYRQAVLSRSQMGTEGVSSIRSQTDALVESSKTKLRLMGLSDSQIRRLSDSRTDPMSLILPKGNVWIYAEVYEYEILGLKVGQTVQVEVPAVPGKLFTGKLTSISPILNPQTRTIRVRALVPDPQGVLRPDAFVNVIIRQELGKKIVVPSDAVLHSGDKDFVFVVKEKGRFVPKQVQVGSKTNEWNEILSGLTEGETVATAANFLIDSESRIRAAAQGSAGEKPPASQTTTPTPGGPK